MSTSCRTNLRRAKHRARSRFLAIIAAWFLWAPAARTFAVADTATNDRSVVLQRVDGTTQQGVLVHCSLTDGVIVTGPLSAVIDSQSGDGRDADRSGQPDADQDVERQRQPDADQDSTNPSRSTNEVTTRLADLVRFHTTYQQQPPRRRDWLIHLRNGDELFGRITAGNEDELTFTTIDLGDVVLPFETIATIDTRQSPATGGPTAPTAHANAAAPAVADLPEDVVVLINGDRLTGFIIETDTDEITLESALGETALRWDVVSAVHFASPGAPTPNEAGNATADRPLRLRLTLQHSGVCTVDQLQWDGDEVEARLTVGPRVSIDAARLVALEVIGGRWEWLSNHEPADFEHTPMLTLGWPYRIDRNVLGEPLRVAGVTYQRGLGVHSRCVLTYHLEGRYQEFVTAYGLDDRSGRLADVDVQILLDAEPLHQARGIRPGTLHGPLRLDVREADQIQLIVDFGAAGDIQDRFDWIEAALIR
jgi:hypothetical protein